MRLNVNDKVRNVKGNLGTVVQADDNMVAVMFEDDGTREWFDANPGWFDREDDNRLTLVAQ